MKNLKSKIVVLSLVSSFAVMAEPSTDAICEISNFVQRQAVLDSFRSEELNSMKNELSQIITPERINEANQIPRNMYEFDVAANNLLDEVMSENENSIGGRKYKKVVIEQGRDEFDTNSPPSSFSPSIIEYVTDDGKNPLLVIKPDMQLASSTREATIDFQILSRSSHRDLDELTSNIPLLERYKSSASESLGNPITSISLRTRLVDRTNGELDVLGLTDVPTANFLTVGGLVHFHGEGCERDRLADIRPEDCRISSGPGEVVTALDPHCEMNRADDRFDYEATTGASPEPDSSNGAGGIEQ